MIDENQYDKDIVLTTLKLYQLNPDRYKETVVQQILLKTLMTFPASDFALAKYLIDSNRIGTPELQRVLDVGSVLAACDFATFWRLMRGEYKPNLESSSERFRAPAEVQKVVRGVAGFEDAVRNFACQVINVTFQRIERPLLSRLLGSISDAAVDEYAKRFGWKPEAADKDVYYVQNHEATIKSRNIEEKLAFDDVRDILRNIQ